MNATEILTTITEDNEIVLTFRTGPFSDDESMMASISLEDAKDLQALLNDTVKRAEGK